MSSFDKDIARAGAIAMAVGLLESDKIKETEMKGLLITMATDFIKIKNEEVKLDLVASIDDSPVYPTLVEIIERLNNGEMG